MRRFRVLPAAAALALLSLAACSGGDGGSEPPPPPEPSVTSVTVTPATRAMSVGDRFTFSAAVAVANGAATTVAWNSSDPSRASVNPTTGEVTAVAATGATPVTITATSTVDATKSATASVTVTAPTPARVDVTPSPATVAVGATTPLAATPKDAQGNAIGGLAAASWTVADAGIATVGGTGTVTGVSAGSTTVTATIAGVQGTVTVNVTGAVRSVSLRGPGDEGAGATLPVGATRQLTATVDADPGMSTALTWTTSDVAVATVSGAGLVTVTGRGTATITATSNVNAQATATASITGLGVSAVDVTPDDPAAFEVGGTAQLSAAVTADAGIATTVGWTSRDPTIATVAANGAGATVTGVAQGSAWIVATSTADAKVADSVRVTVRAACVATPIFIGNNLTGALEQATCVALNGQPHSLYQLQLAVPSALLVRATSQAFVPILGIGTRPLPGGIPFEAAFVSFSANAQVVDGKIIVPPGQLRLGVYATDAAVRAGNYGISVALTAEESSACTNNIITTGVLTQQTFGAVNCVFINNAAYGAFDIYRFALFPGETATVTMNSATLDSKVSLWNQNLSVELATDDNGGGGTHSRLVFTAQNAQVFHLLARRVGNANGQYTLGLTITGPAPLARGRRAPTPAIFDLSRVPFAGAPQQEVRPSADR